MIENPYRVGERLRSARAVFADLDGCLTVGRELAPGVEAFVEFVHDRLWVVSNNSTHDPEELSTRLQSLGLDIRPERIVLAGACAVEAIQSRWPGARVLMLATASLANHARASGLIPVETAPDVILFARDTSLSFGRLDVALRSAVRGCPVVIANPDLTHPLEDGQPTLETGALAAALRAAAPDTEYVVIGKPEPTLFRVALSRAGVSCEAALMIGDNPDTDIAGATRAGITAVLIGRANGAVARNLDELMSHVSDHPHLGRTGTTSNYYF